MKNLQKGFAKRSIILVVAILFIIGGFCLHRFFTAPVIESVYDYQGNVTITGRGFTSENNKLLLVYNSNNYFFGNATSSNGSKLFYRIDDSGFPDNISCPRNMPCLPPPTRFPLGSYTIFISNSNGQSNKVPFTISESDINR